MGAQIVEVRRERLPSLRFVGRRYTDADRGPNGGYGHLWHEWMQKGWFQPLEQLEAVPGIEDGVLGFMGCSDQSGSFEYWIGKFVSESSPVPDSYDSIDLPASDVAICWIYGNANNGELYGHGPHQMCVAKWEEAGMERFRDHFPDKPGMFARFFERYNHPRFTVPDEHGKVILDYGMYLAD